MPLPADLAFSEHLQKNDILPQARLDAELEILDRLKELGLQATLARVLRDRGALGPAEIEKVLALPVSERKADLLAEQIRWLRTSPPEEPPVVDLAVSHGLLAPADLEEARRLEIAAHALGVKKRPLEVLIDRGALLPDAAMALFDAHREPKSALLSPANLLFCSIAHAARIASPRQLQEAVALQRRLFVKTRVLRPVPELLFFQRHVTRPQLESALALLRAQNPGDDPARFEPVLTTDDEEWKIGELLDKTSAVPPERLQECLRLRETMRELGLERRLGELLVLRGYVKRNELDAMLAGAKRTSAVAPPAVHPAVALPNVHPAVALPNVHPAVALPNVHPAVALPAIHPAVALPAVHPAVVPSSPERPPLPAPVPPPPAVAVEIPSLPTITPLRAAPAEPRPDIAPLASVSSAAGTRPHPLVPSHASSAGAPGALPQVSPLGAVRGAHPPSPAHGGAGALPQIHSLPAAPPAPAAPPRAIPENSPLRGSTIDYGSPLPPRIDEERPTPPRPVPAISAKAPQAGHPAPTPHAPAQPAPYHPPAFDDDPPPERARRPRSSAQLRAVARPGHAHPARRLSSAPAAMWIAIAAVVLAAGLVFYPRDRKNPLEVARTPANTPETAANQPAGRAPSAAKNQPVEPAARTPKNQPEPAVRTPVDEPGTDEEKSRLETEVGKAFDDMTREAEEGKGTATKTGTDPSDSAAAAATASGPKVEPGGSSADRSALERKVRGLLDRGEFAAASAAVRADADKLPTAERAAAESRAAALDQLLAFRTRIIAELRRGARPVSTQDLAEFSGLGGQIKEVDEKQVVAATRDGARVGKSWRELSARSVRMLALAAFGAGADVERDAALWALALAPSEEAEAGWERARAGGADLARFEAFHAWSLRSWRLAELARGIAEASAQAARGANGEALTAFTTLRTRFAAFPGLDLSALERAETGTRDAFARAVLSDAQALADAGNPAAALGKLREAFDRCRGSTLAADLELLQVNLTERFLAEVSDFEDEEEVHLWMPLNATLALETAPEKVHSGSGSLRWQIDGGQIGGMATGEIPHDWSRYAFLSLWVHSESASGTVFEIRGESTREDYFGHLQQVDWTGWKRLRLRIDRLNRVGRPSLTSVSEICFWHFPGSPGGTLRLDGLRLETADAPDFLTGGGAGDPVPGPTPGGKPPVGPEPGPAKPPAGSKTPPAAQAKWPRPSGRHYFSLDHGVALVPPEGWDGQPAPKELKEAYRDFQRITGVVRWQDPSADGENRSMVLDLMVLQQVDSLDAAVEEYCKTNSVLADPQARRNGKVGPWPSASFTLDASMGWERTVTIIHEGDRAGVVVVTAGDKTTKRRGEQYRAMARSFLFLSDESVRRIRGAGGKVSSLPAGWKSLLTANYEVQYDCGEEFAKLVGKHLEAILREYKRRFPMKAAAGSGPGVTSAAAGRFTVKVFKTNEDFDSYAAANGVSGAAAYFSPMQDELVCYKTSEEGKDKTFHIIYHEASHQYLHLYMGVEVEIPIWLNEGVAEYFFGGEFKPDGAFRIEENKERLPTIKEAIKQDRCVRLQEFFQYTQAQYYADGQLCYAQGWALAYFLWMTKDKTYTGRLDRYYDVLKSTGDAAEAHSSAFGDLDLAKFEADWKRFILAQ